MKRCNETASYMKGFQKSGSQAVHTIRIVVYGGCYIFGPTVRGNYHVGLDSCHHALLASEHLQNWDNGKENGNYKEYRGYIGIIMGYILGYIGIMERKMETITLLAFYSVA